MSLYSIKDGLVLLLVCIVTCHGVKNFMENMRPETSPVEVTAVFINCENDNVKQYTENENNRFEREELFKHNALKNCDKKLALTIKLSSASAKSADEYVPIEHVLDGSSRQRVRLLNPYVLRVRRDAPLDAYKLRFIETVSGGLLKTSNEQNHKYYSELSKRTIHTEDSRSMADGSELVGTVESKRARHDLRFAGAVLFAKPSPGTPRAYDHRKKKQFSRNAETTVTIPRLNVNPYFLLGTSRRPPPVASMHSQHTNWSDRNTQNISSAKNEGMSAVFLTNRVKRHEKNVVIEDDESLDNSQGDGSEFSPESRFFKATNGNEETSKNDLITEVYNEIYKMNSTPQLKPRFDEIDSIGSPRKEFALYEVGTPMLWFGVHVQLFEKLSTLKGNVLWNDITKGVPVSLSSLSPEWSGSDMNLHYKPAVDVSREEYVLPTSSLCLLIPLLEESINTVSSNKNYALDDSNYILVPSEDVLDINTINRRTNLSANDRHEGPRRVLVRITRALDYVMDEKFNVVNQASDKFLTMRHQGISHAQVDLEARADDNQLVHISAAGRIAMIVADNTRNVRSILTVQATNTGLFASRYRIQLRDCDSDLIKLAEKQEGGVMSEAVVLPPRHSRRLRLRIPDLPAGLQHCSVYLLNGNDESVAVRDAVIKKGDQCYCVWHCDCVCYGDNPSLPCQEMPAARQDAAGLPPRRGARLARACLYSDVMAVNVAVVVIGVIGMLLSFGVIKGLLGLAWPWAGVWGLDWILEEPRQLDRYYERALRGRAVVYDEACWPVHPDTGERTVRVVSLTVEFILNVIFFVAAPGLIAIDALKHLTTNAKGPAFESKTKIMKPNASKKLNNRQDVQGSRRRARRPRPLPRRWMTPEADALSATIWKKDSTGVKLNNLSSLFPVSPDKLAQPPRDPAQTSGSDSDLEDTAFVLMHMQKSTESLAKNQLKNSNTAALPSETEQKSHSKATEQTELNQA